MQINPQIYKDLMGLYLNLPFTSSVCSQHTPETRDLPRGIKGDGRGVGKGLNSTRRQQEAGGGVVVKGTGWLERRVRWKGSQTLKP